MYQLTQNQIKIRRRKKQDKDIVKNRTRTLLKELEVEKENLQAYFAETAIGALRFAATESDDSTRPLSLRGIPQGLGE